METRLCKTLKSWNHHTTQEATQSHVHNYFHVVTLKWKYNFLRKREHGQHSSNEEVGFPLQIGSAFEVKGGGGETETVFPDLYNAQWQIQIYSKGKILHCVKDFTQNNHLSTPNAHAYRHICLFVFWFIKMRALCWLLLSHIMNIIKMVLKRNIYCLHNNTKELWS